VAAWIDGGDLTLATVAGAFAVLALAVRQVLDLFGRAQALEREERRPLSHDLVHQVAGERCGPVVTTVGVTALALLPIVVVGSIAGQEIVKPLAVAVLGGLVTCTIAVLFVLPPVYLRAAPRRPDDGRSLVAHDPDPAAEPVAAETVDTVLSWPAPPAATTSEG
jgi:Cu/Ag efflux pump CusA